MEVERLFFEYETDFPETEDFSVLEKKKFYRHLKSESRGRIGGAQVKKMKKTIAEKVGDISVRLANFRSLSIMEK